MITDRERSELDANAARLYDLYEKEQHAPLLNEVDELSKVGPLAAGVLGVASLALTALERYEEAVTGATAALQREPNAAWCFGALAAAEAGRGRAAEAVAIQRKAVRLRPGAAVYAAALARYLRQADRLAEAQQTAVQALVSDPFSPTLLVELGICLQTAGDADAALEQYRAARLADPTEVAGPLREGTLLGQLGRHWEARQALHAALKLDPGNQEAEGELARTIAKTGLASGLVRHLLRFGRITLIGWLAISFFYYLWFRLVQFVWHMAPNTLPVGRVILLGTLAYLLLFGGAGRLLRMLFRIGWPR